MPIWQHCEPALDSAEQRLNHQRGPWKCRSSLKHGGRRSTPPFQPAYLSRFTPGDRSASGHPRKGGGQSSVAPAHPSLLARPGVDRSRFVVGLTFSRSSRQTRAVLLASTGHALGSRASRLSAARHARFAPPAQSERSGLPRRPGRALPLCWRRSWRKSERPWSGSCAAAGRSSSGACWQSVSLSRACGGEAGAD